MKWLVSIVDEAWSALAARSIDNYVLVDSDRNGSAGAGPSREPGHSVESRMPLSVTSREWESRKLKVLHCNLMRWNEHTQLS